MTEELIHLLVFVLLTNVPDEYSVRQRCMT